MAYTCTHNYCVFLDLLFIAVNSLKFLKLAGEKTIWV